MKFGVLLPSYSTTGCRARPEVIVDVARRAEELGFDGVWAVEHITKPTTYNTGWLEPLTVLGWAGSATSRVDLGTGIVVFPLRNPALLAWQAAGLQYLSGGRLKLGFGAGYSEEEYELVGVPMAERGRRFDEGLEVFKRLLSESAVEHDGRFWKFSGATIEPLARPMPEIFIAGGSRSLGGDGVIPTSVKRRIISNDGWASSPKPVEQVERDWAEIAAYAKEQGRDPGTISRLHVNYAYFSEHADRQAALAEQREALAFLYSSFRSWDDYVEPNCFTGSIDDLQERVEGLRRAGVTYLALGFPSNDPAGLTTQLERYRKAIVEPFRGGVS